MASESPVPSPSPIDSGSYSPRPKSPNLSISSHLICSGGNHLLESPRLLPCLHRFCAACFTKEATKQAGKLLQRGLEESCNSHHSQPPSTTTEVKVEEIEFTCPVAGCDERTVICMHENGHVTYPPSNSSLQSMLDSHNFERRLVAGEELCGDCPENSRQVAVAACIDEDRFDIPLCRECLQRHKTATSSSNHTVIHVDNLKQNVGSLSASTEQTPKSLHHRAPICHLHPDQCIRMYCPEHNTVVCLVCASTDCVERGHEGCRGKFDVNVDAANRHIQEEFDPEVEHLSVLNEEFEHAINDTNSVKDRLGERSDTVQREINDCFEALKARLEQRRDELINQTREICRLKTEAIDHHLGMLNDKNNTIKESLDFIRDFRRNAIPAELFFVKRQIEERIKSLRHQFKYYTRVEPPPGGLNEGEDLQPRVHPDPLIHNDKMHYNTDNVNIEQGMGTVFSSPWLNKFEPLESRSSNTIIRLACRDIYGTYLIGELPNLQASLLPHVTENDELTGCNRVTVSRKGVYCSIQSNSKNGTYSFKSSNTTLGHYRLYVSYPHPPPFFSYENEGQVIPVDFNDVFMNA